jgi:hypothetical protein
MSLPKGNQVNFNYEGGEFFNIFVSNWPILWKKTEIFIVSNENKKKAQIKKKKVD